VGFRYSGRVESSSERSETLRALAALDDASRRGLYDAVRAASTPLTREQAATEVGISHKLAAFHLDKLVAAGLLVADYDPAARSRRLGRTPKTYRPSARQLSLSIPERQPEVLAELLLDAITSADPGESPREAALRVGEQVGHQLGTGARVEQRSGRLGPERAVALAERLLAGRGYEPARQSPTCLRLRNCPFEPVTAHATELVCAINHRFIEGLLRGLGAARVEAVLAPAPSRCCVEIHTR
jgi:predicted ArsR family transcriptional regulator